ncbi:hypothetical protein Taro_014796 [Colocasia esculenta]|uniref:Uncharacterized protein n=1 Tax=Colocasia esculenta TaxID=4460 RepID=A0A843U9Y5_COLES|nr:hypothetical protein [Colocasia esculenta]
MAVEVVMVRGARGRCLVEGQVKRDRDVGRRRRCRRGGGLKRQEGPEESAILEKVNGCDGVGEYHFFFFRGGGGWGGGRPQL